MTMVDQHAGPDLTLALGNDVSAGSESSWERTDWQRMWLRTQSLEWRTLALVPGDDQTSTLDVANLIARLALDHGESIRVADIRALRMKHVDAFLEGVRWEGSQGTRVVFATSPASRSLATVPVARSADCVILCVSLGSTSLSAVRDTIEHVGRRHFLGSLLVTPPAPRPKGLPHGSHASTARIGS
jgi:hypothetical protein